MSALLPIDVVMHTLCYGEGRCGCLDAQDIGSCMLVSRQWLSTVEPQAHVLLHRYIRHRVPCLFGFNLCVTDDQSLCLLMHSNIDIPRMIEYIDCVGEFAASALNREPVSARALNKIAVMSKNGLLRRPATRGSSRDAKFIQPMRFMFYNMNTLIVLSCLSALTNELYRHTLFTDTSKVRELLQITAGHPNHSNRSNSHTVGQSYDHHIDFRMWADYMLFGFVNKIYSDERMDRGRALGKSFTKLLTSQLIDTWKTHWNYNNTRLLKRLRSMLEVTYRKLCRAFSDIPFELMKEKFM